MTAERPPRPTVTLSEDEYLNMVSLLRDLSAALAGCHADSTFVSDAKCNALMEWQRVRRLIEAREAAIYG